MVVYTRTLVVINSYIEAYSNGLRGRYDNERWQKCKLWLSEAIKNLISSINVSGSKETSCREFISFSQK